MSARNRDAAVAASWQQHHCSLSAPRRSAGTAAAARSCGVAAVTAAMCVAVVTMRSVLPGAAALARAWVVKPTENPLPLLITATLSPSRRARLTILNAYRVKGF